MAGCRVATHQTSQELERNEHKIDERQHNGRQLDRPHLAGSLYRHLFQMTPEVVGLLHQPDVAGDHLGGRNLDIDQHSTVWHLQSGRIINQRADDQRQRGPSAPQFRIHGSRLLNPSVIIEPLPAMPPQRISQHRERFFKRRIGLAHLRDARLRGFTNCDFLSERHDSLGELLRKHPHIAGHINASCILFDQA